MKSLPLWIVLLGGAAIGAIATSVLAKPPPTTLCTPGERRGQVACWDGSVAGGEECAADGMSWFPLQGCPPCCAEGEYQGAQECWNGEMYGGKVCQSCEWVTNPITSCPPQCLCTPGQEVTRDCPNGSRIVISYCAEDCLSWVETGNTCTQEQYPTSIILDGSGSVQVGSDEVVDATLMSGSAPLPGKTVAVTVQRPDGSSTSPQSFVTDASGGFSFAYAPTVEGQHIVRASFAGDAAYYPSNASLGFSAVGGGTETYDYKIVGLNVLGPSGAVLYTGGDLRAAINWGLAQTGKVTYLPAGTYSLPGNLYPASGTTLLGDGPDSTILNFTNTNRLSSCVYVDTVDDVTLKGFRLTGNGAAYFRIASGTHGNYLVQDVTAYRTGKIQLACFFTWVYQPSVIDGFRFIRVHAIEPDTDGFCFYGNMPGDVTARPGGGIVRNVLFEDCSAQYCGMNDRYDIYTCGWRLNEGVNAENVHFVRCDAENCWKEGFHLEDSGGADNIVFDECDASYNGIGAGEYEASTGIHTGCHAGWSWQPRAPYTHTVVLNNCTGYGNYSWDIGYLMYGGVDYGPLTSDSAGHQFPNGDLPPPG